MSETSLDHSSQQTYAIALPCAPEDFSKFIGSLLGKPQTISDYEGGVFELRREDLINSYHLVAQRVMQQNEAHLIQFIVRLVFDDGSSVLLNSLDDFTTYNEVRPIVVTQAHLSWSFLVQFRDRSHPEKQEIDLSFMTHAPGAIALSDSDDASFVPMARLVRGGRIFFRIRHTARTWGADIESLLSGHAKHLILPQPRLREFARLHSGTIAVAIGLLFFVSTIAVCLFSADRIAAEQLNTIASLLQKSGAFDLKLNRLLQLAADGFWGKYFFSVLIFIIFSFVTSIVLGIWAGSTADARKPSYILLTKKSEQHKIAEDHSYKLRWLSFLASIAGSIATGIISNILFAKYWAG
jgi:hypothetical protein